LGYRLVIGIFTDSLFPKSLCEYTSDDLAIQSYYFELGTHQKW